MKRDRVSVTPGGVEDVEEFTEVVVEDAIRVHVGDPTKSSLRNWVDNWLLYGRVNTGVTTHRTLNWRLAALS